MQFKLMMLKKVKNNQLINRKISLNKEIILYQSKSIMFNHLLLDLKVQSVNHNQLTPLKNPINNLPLHSTKFYLKKLQMLSKNNLKLLLLPKPMILSLL